VLKAALDAAAEAVDRVVRVEGDRLFAQEGREVGAADQRLQPIERSKAEQIIDRRNRA